MRQGHPDEATNPQKDTTMIEVTVYHIMQTTRNPSTGMRENTPCILEECYRTNQVGEHIYVWRKDNGGVWGWDCLTGLNLNLGYVPFAGTRKQMISNLKKHYKNDLEYGEMVAITLSKYHANKTLAKISNKLK